MASQFPHQRGTRETTKPDAMIKLMAKIGTSAAARRVGVSRTTLLNARRKGVVSAVIEQAAFGALVSLDNEPALPRKLEAKQPEKVILVVEAPQPAIPIVEKIVAALHGQVVAAAAT